MAQKFSLPLLVPKPFPEMHITPEQYTAVLYGSILRMLPGKELAQQALKRAVYKIQSTQPAYGAAKMRFLTWAVNIARDECIHYLALNKDCSPLIWKKENANSSLPSQDLKPMERVLIELICVRRFTVAEAAKMLSKTDGEINEVLGKINLQR